MGVFTKKKFPKTDKKLKYGLIIPARNEEKVVGNLIKSIQKCDYPQDKLQIFVIAHNCMDNTAQICRELGATVYEYNNPDECTMGYAFRYLFNKNCGWKTIPHNNTTTFEDLHKNEDVVINQETNSQENTEN